MFSKNFDDFIDLFPILIPHKHWNENKTHSPDFESRMLKTPLCSENVLSQS